MPSLWCRASRQVSADSPGGCDSLRAQESADHGCRRLRQRPAVGFEAMTKALNEVAAALLAVALLAPSLLAESSGVAR